MNYVIGVLLVIVVSLLFCLINKCVDKKMPIQIEVSLTKIIIKIGKQ